LFVYCIYTFPVAAPPITFWLERQGDNQGLSLSGQRNGGPAGLGRYTVWQIERVGDFGCL